MTEAISEGLTALGIILFWISLTAMVGLYFSIKYRKAWAESWFVAGRRLGLLILWLSLGANIYSAYTFLGLPGYTVKNGVKVLAILIYGQLSYILAYLITPKLWELGKAKRYVTLSDYFEDRYNSKLLGALTAIVGALFSIPYIQLQILGIGYIIESAGYGLLDPFASQLIAFSLIAIFTILGGMVSVAFINALQGAIMLITIWGIGFLIPMIRYGGIGPMFEAFESVKPSMVLFDNKLIIWTATLAIASSVGFWMWPNRIQGVFTAKSSDTVKRNALALSFFQISQIPIILVGLTAATLYYQGVLKLPKPDYALIEIIKFTFPSWVVGIAGAGAVAAAISTAAALLHTSGALFARNAYQRLFKPEAKERELVMAARIFTGAIAIIALILAVLRPALIVYLLLTGYAGVTQFFPGIALGIKWKKVTKNGVLLGLIAGIITAILTRIVTVDPLGIFGGFWGLAINFAVTVSISLLEHRLRGFRERKNIP
ncbi:MAG TPA: sodium:solute symporter family protein [Acidilobales archaeon]|nr:sodium:solute symporter family protein [Acidilobales archaeon]